MQRNRLPDQIGLRLGDAACPEKVPRGVGTVDLKSLCFGVVVIDQAEVVKQRRDIKQLGIEFQLLTQPLHRAEHVDADRMVEQHLVFVAAHQLGGLARQLAVGNFHAGNHARHFLTPALH